MPNVRQIWHFRPKIAQHPKLYTYTIAKKFAIVLQCNSTCRIALSHNCKKKKKTLFYSLSLSSALTLPLSQLCPPCLYLFQISPSPFPLSQCYLLRWVRCGFDGFAPMWVWFTPIGISWVKWWVSMVGHGLWVMGFGFGLIWV